MNPFLHATVARAEGHPQSPLPDGAGGVASDTGPQSSLMGLAGDATEQAASGAAHTHTDGCARMRSGRVTSLAQRARQGHVSQRAAQGLRRAWRTFVHGVAVAGLCLGTLAGAHAAVNVNTASPEELRTLRGVGPKTAEDIVSERNRAGPFESVQDFTDRVRGIGAKRAQSLQAAGMVVAPAGGPVAEVASGTAAPGVATPARKK